MSALPITLYQVEDTKVDGELKLTKIFEAPTKSPEEIMQERNDSRDLYNAVGRLKKDDQELCERIHHYRDQNDLIKHVAQHFKNELSEEKIKSILLKLAKSIPQN